MSSQALLDQLNSLYSNLDFALPKTSVNPCGSCNKCCTAHGVDRQSVSEIEFDYLASRFGQEIVQSFRHFAARERNEAGKFLFETCPFYDQNQQGCGIHADRPFSCRTFGPYRLEGTRFPENCVFEGQETEIKREQGYKALPLATELKDLSRQHWPFSGPRLVIGSPQTHVLAKDEAAPGDPGSSGTDGLELAFKAMAEDDFERALIELEKPSSSSETAQHLYYLALTLSQLERHQEASLILDQGLRLAPQSWELHYLLGACSYRIGERERSLRAFLKTVEVNPLHALAWGFLGYIALDRKLFVQALEFLENACMLDDKNLTLRLRLAKTYMAQDQIEKAIEHLKLASDLSGTAEESDEVDSLITALRFATTL